MAVRDLDEAVRFWTSIFDAHVLWVNHSAHFGEVRVAGIIIGFAEGEPGATGHGEEYPHWGFTVEPSAMRPLQHRLHAFGVPTSDIWTRRQVEALMYFRDPSGNLLEFYCPQGFDGVADLPLGVFGGGTYEPDLFALHYDTWNDSTSALEKR